ncbi:hypothetical protein [Peptacetobacter sp. AB845]|uniref:hypothetical protein n=1 Tax=Peptacetobacter sp. AB845 TaxID=3388429 RepID=UPI0039C97A06
MTDVLKDVPTEVLLAEVKFREMQENKKPEYLTPKDLQEIYGYTSDKYIYKKIKEDGILNKKYKVVRSNGDSGKILIDKESFMKFLNGGEKDD